VRGDEQSVKNSGTVSRFKCFFFLHFLLQRFCTSTSDCHHLGYLSFCANGLRHLIGSRVFTVAGPRVCLEHPAGRDDISTITDDFQRQRLKTSLFRAILS